MENIRSQVITLLQTPQLANLATITLDGKPWTRYVMITSDEAFQIRSAVNIYTRKIKQIEKNPEVHLTFGITNPQDLGHPYVQIQATATVSTDPKEKQAYWFDMLSHVFEGPDDPDYGIMTFDPYRVELIEPGSMTPLIWRKNK